LVIFSNLSFEKAESLANDKLKVHVNRRCPMNKDLIISES